MECEQEHSQSVICIYYYMEPDTDTTAEQDGQPTPERTGQRDESRYKTRPEQRSLRCDREYNAPYLHSGPLLMVAVLLAMLLLRLTRRMSLPAKYQTASTVLQRSTLSLTWPTIPAQSFQFHP